MLTFGWFEPGDEDKFNAWLAEHDKTCRMAGNRNTGAIGGRLTYSFTPTSLGTVTKVTCACGKGEIDLSHYEDW